MVAPTDRMLSSSALIGSTNERNAMARIISVIRATRAEDDAGAAIQGVQDVDLDKSRARRKRPGCCGEQP